MTDEQSSAGDQDNQNLKRRLDDLGVQNHGMRMEISRNNDRLKVLEVSIKSVHRVSSVWRIGAVLDIGTQS